MDRKTIIESLKKNPEVDVLVVGAGINGAGVFRDLALNGVNVLLVDKGRFLFRNLCHIIPYGTWRHSLSGKWRISPCGRSRC